MLDALQGLCAISPHLALDSLNKGGLSGHNASSVDTYVSIPNQWCTWHPPIALRLPYCAEEEQDTSLLIQGLLVGPKYLYPNDSALADPF